MKSARSNNTKKPENIGTGTVRSRDKDTRNDGETSLDLPPPVPVTLDPPAPSPTVSYNKPSFPPPEPPAAKERPGFFRRMFGSKAPASDQDKSESPSLEPSDSKSSTASTANHTGRQPQKNAAKTGAPAREGPRQVVNKKSSFFRRRKKSVVDSAPPPPIVIPQDIGPRPFETKAEPSPVSSLRKVMDPYLDESSAPSQDTKDRPSSEPAKENISQKAPLPQKQKRGSALAPSGSRPAYSRSQPASRGNDGSSMADSGTDLTADNKPLAPDTHQAHDSSASAKDEPKPHDSVDKPADIQEPAPQNDVPPQPAGLSPVVEDSTQKDAAKTSDGQAESKESSGLGPDRQDEPNKLSPTDENASPTVSTSETSNYYTASNTPVIPSEEPKSAEATGPTKEDREQAQKLFDSQDQVVGNEPAAAWLGDPDRAMIRQAYMGLFDWSRINIMAALRSLCTRLVLKGETQQVDRVLDAFSARWCECNPRHGFKVAGTYAAQPLVTR